MPETKLGYKQLVREVLNREFHLNLIENKNIKDGYFDLIDTNKGFIVDIDNILISGKTYEELERIATEFKPSFKVDTAFFTVSTPLSDEHLITSEKLPSGKENLGRRRFTWGLNNIIDAARKNNIDFAPYIGDLDTNDSLIQAIINGSYSEVLRARNEQKPTKSQAERSIKKTKNDSNLQRVPLKKKNKFDSSSPPTISRELTLYNYYFAQIYWHYSGNQLDEFIKNNIWKSRTGFSKYANLVQNGDVLLGVKPNFNQKRKTYEFQFEGIGYVYKNENKTDKLGVTWKKIASTTFSSKEIANNTNLSLGEITKSKVIPILQGIASTIQPSIESIIDELKERADNLLKQEATEITEEKDTHENITRLAGIQSDSDDGEDYLGIEEDVTAFARVMSAKSFNPPLAIGLLGRWGSGKSFFMRKLQERIQKLSKNDPQNIYCKGIAHVHFNVWSYMDANLWASIVTRIFESLNLYIKDEKVESEEEKLIQEEIAKKLSITHQQVTALELEKNKVNQKVKTLKGQKNGINANLKSRINQIKKGSLSTVLKTLDESFQVSKKVEKALKDNPSFIKTSDQLQAVIPKEYWDNPSHLYEQFQLKKYSTLFNQLRNKATWKQNAVWLILIGVVVIGVPFLLKLLTDKFEAFDFNPPRFLWYAIYIFGSATTLIRQSLKKISPVATALWKIKEDYLQQKEAAIFEFEQQEKALQLEIKNFQIQIDNINNRIEQAEDLAKNLQFRIDNTLSTETLFHFIEKRATSNEYQKHLGIISLIRKDFEILSNLFQGNLEEEESKRRKKDYKPFYKRFKNPLDRIILYIDDLDRCDQDRVVEVLEAVNLLMAFPLFIVVVGVDPRWVKNALLNKHKFQFTEKADTALDMSPSNYLEKIFQIPFHLKSAQEKDVKVMLRALAESKQQELPSEAFEDRTTELQIAPEKIQKKATPQLDSKETATPKKINELPERPRKKEVPNISSSAPTETLKERIELLKFAENELNFIESMSVVLGNNPRVIKRFVNIYRIIKAHEIFKYSSETADEEILAVLFMIALPLGDYKQLIDSFKQFILGAENNSLESYLQPQIGRPRTSQHTELFHKLNQNHKNLLNIDRDTFLHQYYFVRRFTFQ